LSKELEAFYKGEQARLDKQREEYLEGKGYKNFMKWEIGDNAFELQPIVPREGKSFGKDRKIFRIMVEDEEFDWSVTPESPMYRQIIYEYLPAAPVGLVLTRVGLGADTKYHLRAAKCAVRIARTSSRSQSR